MHQGVRPEIDAERLLPARDDLVLLAGFGDEHRTGNDLVIHAEGGIARCDMHVSRFGANVLPFRAAPYAIRTPLGDTTPEGTVSPSGPITVVAGQLTLQCGGAECGSLVPTILDDKHVEGYLSGSLADPSDGQVSSVVCTFYVPWRIYQP